MVEFKYGIENLIIFESDRKLDSSWISALGGNVELIEPDSESNPNSKPKFSRAETIQKLSRDFVAVRVRGILPCQNVCRFSSSSNKQHLSNVVFYNASSSLYLTEESVSIKSPLKPNSNLKQIIKKGENIFNFELGISNSKIGRKIEVKSNSKNIISSPIPISFW